jgi:hypothetical protein
MLPVEAWLAFHNRNSINLAVADENGNDGGGDYTTPSSGAAKSRV